MRIARRFGVMLASATLIALTFGWGTALAADENHGIGLSKGCIGVTRLGDPYRCSYAVTNNTGIDEAGDTLTMTSLVDTINRPGSPNSGNILQIPGIGAIVSFDALAGNVTPASCSGLGTAAAICTLPSQSRIRIGGVGGVPGFSFYNTTTTSAVPPASDYDVNPVTHVLTDTVALVWQDTCSSGTNNCPQGNQSATTGSSTTLIKRNSSTVTDIHNAAHQTVLTVGAGSTVHDFVTVTGDPNQPTPSGMVTIDWFLNGDCSGAPAVNSGPVGPLTQNATNSTFDATGFSFTVNSAGFRAFRAHYLGDAMYNPSDGACEPLRVVDANIQITPDDTNRIGDSHIFTGHVNVNDGTGFVNAPDGTSISFTIDSGPGAFTTPNPCTTAGGTGSCTVTLISAVTGVTTVSAHTTVSVGGVALTRDTNGVGANSGPARKTWVNARISIAPNATNEVGQPHTFVVTLEKDTGTGVFVPAAGEHVDVTLTNSNGAVFTAPTGTCTAAGANTNAAGQCTITFSSPSAGQVTGHASSTLVIGGVSITVQTNGLAGNSADAVKTFVDANIQITPQTATNPVSTNHTLTGHVNINAGLGGGYVNAPAGTLISFSLTNAGGATASFVGPNTCLTVAATGSCTVVISSSTTGTTTIKATTTVTVGGVPLTRTTGDGKLGDSADANKIWASARIAITPSATNEVGQPHTFTVTLSKDAGAGLVPAAGEHVDVTLTNSNGAGFVLNAAASTCDDAGPNTNAAGQCVITFTSPTAGQVTGHASSTLTINGATITVQTNGANGNSGDAVKTFVDANIQITPATANNPVSTNHTLTGHVNINAGGGAGYVNAPAGTLISFSLTNAGGATASFVGPNTCLTVAATGSCTVVISSSTTGTTTIKATTTVTVGGVPLTRTTGDGKLGDSADANKTWSDAVVTTQVHDPAHADITNTEVPGGTVVHDEATVSKAAGTPASAPAPTGTVTFTLYNNGTCNGAVLATDPNKPLNASGVATSVTFTTPTAGGSFSYLARYNGDANYPARNGPCEPFSVKPPVTGQITPTNVECADIMSGSAPTLAQINYTVSGGKIAQSINPGVFFFWTTITTTVPNQVVTVSQSNTSTNNAALFTVHQGWDRLYKGDCSSYTSGTLIAGGSGATFLVPTPGTYIIGIKYSTKSIAGTNAPVPSDITYNFSTSLGGTTGASVLLKRH